MIGGWGVSVVVAFAVMIVAAIALIEWMAFIAREFANAYLRDEAERGVGFAEMPRAEAQEPELAAARMGGCSDCFDD